MAPPAYRDGSARRQFSQTLSTKAPEMELKFLLPALLHLALFQLISGSPNTSMNPSLGHPVPTPWPDRFRALLYMNLSKGNLQMSDVWYDWPRGRNVNIFQKQLGVVLYDIEWDNGTSFYYTTGERDGESCQVMEFGVGIPRPDFMLDGARYLGTELTDGGFLCHVWEKAEFIWYYEDVVSKRPVRWDFYDGISSHVMTFEEGAILNDSVTQAPSYCFNQDLELKARRCIDDFCTVNPLRGNSDQGLVSVLDQ